MVFIKYITYLKTKLLTERDQDRDHILNNPNSSGNHFYIRLKIKTWILKPYIDIWLRVAYTNWFQTQ